MAHRNKTSAADRRRPSLWDGLVVLCVAALAVVLGFSYLPRQGGAQLSAAVVKDGEQIAILHLYAPAASEESAFYPVEGARYPMVLEYKLGAIRVSSTKCPGRDCMHTGWIREAGRQIICLPNRVIVTVTGGSTDTIDAITG